jgi:uncharacterized protein YndB with AHSA1/START domain
MEIALYLLAGVVAVVAVVVAYASTRPDTFRVARSIRIGAPPEKIFALLNDFRNFRLWSPYETKDPDMTRTFSGAEAGPGARYDWEGNKNVGKGWLLISSSARPSRIDMDLNMVAPIAAKNAVSFTLAPDGSGTLVTWAMQGHAPLAAKVMHLILNVDRMVGGDFETGLAKLKAVAERA